MSDISDCIIKLLTDNGVSVEQTVIWNDNGLVRNKKSIIELDFSKHDKVFEDRIAKLEENVGYYKDSLSRVEKNCDKLYHENKELNQRIAELECKETETCAKEQISDDCRPSIEWYENRYQSDCIEINRLNTTIDVLIHKVEYLRQFAGLE